MRSCLPAHQVQNSAELSILPPLCMYVPSRDSDDEQGNIEDDAGPSMPLSTAVQAAPEVSRSGIGDGSIKPSTPCDPLLK
eukprot:1142543-Pelagomonas_calceolata.AAC.5